MGEPKPIRRRSLELEYRFDRLLPDKLAHVYQLLVPDKRQPIGGEPPKPANPNSGVKHEQASSDLCACVLGPPEGESHHRQPDGGADRVRSEERIQRAAGMGLVRPGLEALRDLAAEGQIAAALIYSPDRLSRKYAYQVLLSEELARCGVELIFLKAPAGATAEDQLLVQFQGMIAEYERAQIAERCRRGKKHMAQQGGVNVLSGAPYGYRYVRKSDTSISTLSTPAAPLLDFTRRQASCRISGRQTLS